MSMKLLTVLQFIKIFGAYSVMTLLLPALLFYSRIRNQKFSVRFMAYQMAGNFYMMNLVFLLQLLHISNPVTLWLFTLGPFLAAYAVLHQKKPLRAALSAIETLKRLAGGQLGARLFLHRIGMRMDRFLKRGIRAAFIRLRRNFLDVVLVIGLTALLLYLYGTNAVTNYGYCASDIPVHNYWINYLGKDQLFVAGVYPFGFHCVVYYLHAVFGIETYVLLRLFWLVQTMMIHYILLAFIRVCCKSKYTAYLGVGIYTTVGIFSSNTYTRFYSSLPQEFGMLFILPSIYFLFAFFERKHQELEKEKKEKEEREDKEENKQEKKYANWYLAGFVISFSMTLAAHFYDTMIAGLFCIGIAVGYFFRLFRKQYFGRIMLAGILSIFIAVLPMGIAFATGTPLQGSLGWGMNVITGGGSDNASDSEDEDTENENQAETEEGQGTEAIAGNGTETGTESVAGSGMALGTETASGEGKGAGNGIQPQPETAPGNAPEHMAQKSQPVGPKPPLLDRLKSIGERVFRAVWDAMVTYLIPGDRLIYQWAVFISIAVLGILAILFFLLRQTDYAARFLSAAAFMVFMSILLGASRIGIPALMDAIRTCIFYAYTIVIVWSFCADGILQLLFGWMKKKWLMNLVSLLLVGAAGAYIVQEDLMKEPRIISALQTNEAITCLTNILHDNPDGTWTICSANDELRMVEDYGYHYEVSTFLGEMEYSGGYSTITMPTHMVYFFIEKKPLDYSVSYENSGQYISEEGAKRALPPARGVSMYQGENRWIEMSRMYYWAQKFMELYPNEMEVYYETEDFVCYSIEQNDYSLYNFSINYGYNMMEHRQEEEPGNDIP